jgi:hypothetical protein
MPSSYKNIPISISLLHEQEYYNLCVILKINKGKINKRRVFSDKSSDRSYSENIIHYKNYIIRRKTLKN